VSPAASKRVRSIAEPLPARTEPAPSLAGVVPLGAEPAPAERVAAQPYRQAAPASAPIAQIAWRRKVGHGAELLVAQLLVGFALVPLETRPSRLAWLLRASVIGNAALSLGTWLHFVPPGAAIPAFACVSVFGLAYVARLFEAVEDRKRARLARLLIAPLVAGDLVLALDALLKRVVPAANHVGPHHWLVVASVLLLPFSVAGFVAMIWAFILLLRIRMQTAVVDHAWWFDDRAPPGHWVSLLTHRDGHAEAIAADHRIGIFPSKDAARAWLEANGFVRGKRAVKRGLVDGVPPNPS
jgi:hypothetical protein